MLDARRVEEPWGWSGTEATGQGAEFHCEWQSTWIERLVQLTGFGWCSWWEGVEGGMAG